MALTVRRGRAELLALTALTLMEARRSGVDALGPEELRRLHKQPEAWLRTFFPRAFHDEHGREIPLGPHHEDFWAWLEAIEPGVAPAPFLAAWARGGGKSTSSELAVVRLGGKQLRKFCLYVSGTQKQANEHVQSITRKLETPLIEASYPDLGQRALTKYGMSEGWRQDRITTRGNFVVHALGLDAASRGIKVKDERPDVIVIDDVDSSRDSLETVERKLNTLAADILPTLSPDGVTMGVQNLIHRDSIFARLFNVSDHPTDILADRILSGPVPALDEFAAEPRPEGGSRITHGIPRWAGQGIEQCQSLLNRIGLRRFRSECLHDLDSGEEGVFAGFEFRHCAWAELPRVFDRIVVWVDPAVTSNDQSDSQAICAVGVRGRTAYVLYGWEARASPERVLRMAIRKGVELKATRIGVETDQGGDLWQTEYLRVGGLMAREGLIHAEQLPRFRQAKAGAGFGSKAHRWNELLSIYERGEVVHALGTHETTERALRRAGVRKPFDLADATYWAVTDGLSPKGVYLA